MIVEIIPQIEQLSEEEKWTLVEELWQELLPPAGHEPRAEIIALLDERMAEFRRDPGCAAPWEEVKARLRAARRQ